MSGLPTNDVVTQQNADRLSVISLYHGNKRKEEWSFSQDCFQELISFDQGKDITNWLRWKPTESDKKIIIFQSLNEISAKWTR